MNFWTVEQLSQSYRLVENGSHAAKILISMQYSLDLCMVKYIYCSLNKRSLFIYEAFFLTYQDPLPIVV
jgi:hypothetical protein